LTKKNQISLKGFTAI